MTTDLPSRRTSISPRHLEGRVALVTGGLRGIGQACCDRLRAAGARVFAADLDATGDGADYLRLDVTDEDAWRAAVAAIAARAGRLDMLIANAGTDLVCPVDQIALADWRRLMAVNLDGVFLATKHCAALLDATGRTTPAGSAIVNVSSIMGLVGYANTAAYNTSKGAVRLFSKATAIEFAQARRPIRVNSLHPGFVRTPLLMAGMQRTADTDAGAIAAGASAAMLIESLAAATPNGRVAEPDEIAAVAVFLLSDDASYMTGAEIAVDGGWTAQ